MRLISILIVLVSLVGALRVAHSTSPTLPVGIHVSLTSLSSSSIRISMKCFSADSITEGAIYLLVSPDSGAAPDSIVLWTGSSKSDTFQRSFVHTFASKGKKSAIKAVFKTMGPASRYIIEEPYFILHLPDTILTDRNSYGGLEDAEIQYELVKGGYENLTNEQLRIADLRLWKRRMKRLGSNRDNDN